MNRTINPPGRWTALSASERESFLAAIARHRRASWRVTAACALAVVVLAIAVAILMAPLIYCVVGLGFDVANLVTPAPDVMGWMGRQIDVLSSAKTVPPSSLVQVGVVLAIPGLALIGIATYALRRVWTRSPLFAAGTLPGRAPDRSVLEEERLANVVEEMALAAGIPVPRIAIVPGGMNAAACGRDQAHATLLVGDALPAGVSREQLAGMIAHLVGSIVNGDMVIGLRVTTTLSLFGLAAKIGTSFNDRHALRHAIALLRIFVAPRSADALALFSALADPFRASNQRDAAEPHPDEGKLTWSDWLLMPLMGPVVLTGFLAGMVTQFFLEPLVAAAWRQRKYMADATAVQLTRDPDALAGALAAIDGSPTAMTPWTAHLAVAADPRGRSGPFATSFVPIFPSLRKRVAALDRMGAHVSLAARPAMPWPIVLLLGVAAVVVAGLMSVVVFLLVVLSTALSGLFTIVPAALLHLLLRWAGR